MTRSITLSVLLVIAAFAATAFYYPHLPDPMPIHFDVYGRPNGWARLPWGALLTPLVMAGVAVVFALSHMRVASRHGEDATRALDIVSLVSLAFVLEVHFVVLAFAAGAHVNVDRWVFTGLALLLVITGNWFGKLRRNSFVGIRTTRTLADDEVWLLSHRFGARVMVLGGLVLFIAAVAGASPALSLGIIAVTSLAPILYSYAVKPGSKQ